MKTPIRWASAVPFVLSLSLTLSLHAADPIAPQQAVDPEHPGANKPADPTHEMGKQALDGEILSEIHHTNQMEVAAGQLAAKNSQDPEIQRYGSQLIQDHQNADALVTQVASQESVQLTTPAPKSADDRREMQEQQAMMDRLKTMQGADFNQNFLRTMANGHRHAISDLTAAEAKVSKPVRDLITQLLPKLREHRQMASNLLKKYPSAG